MEDYKKNSRPTARSVDRSVIMEKLSAVTE
jgi:hypothetical protein